MSIMRIPLSPRPRVNIWTDGEPRPDTMLLEGLEVPTAIDPASVTYWLESRQVSEAQAFAQDLWLHFTFGKPLVQDHLQAAAEQQGLTVYAGITPEQLVDAIATLQQPWTADVMGRYSPDEIVVSAVTGARGLGDVVGGGWG
jgi:hypothetical protein